MPGSPFYIRWVPVRVSGFTGFFSSDFNAPARVRDRLWEKVERESGDGSGVLLFSARNEQGFTVRAFGDRRRFPADFEGLTLIQQFPDR